MDEQDLRALSDRSERLTEAAGVLREWGAMAEWGRHDGMLIIRCHDCPLAVAATGHPEVCRLLETMLADLVRAPVQQRCQADPVSQCYFEIEPAGR